MSFVGHDDPVSDHVGRGLLGSFGDPAASLVVFTLPRPMRAFLSMIARSATEFAPMPNGGCGCVRAFSATLLRESRDTNPMPHEIGVADRDVLADDRPDPDHRILDHRAAADHASRRRSGCS